MTDSEGEIEFLDEDADLVYQYMQSSLQNDAEESKSDSLLVERKSTRRNQNSKRGRLASTSNEEDSDTDYDPSKDLTFNRRKVPKLEHKVGKTYPPPQTRHEITKKKVLSNLIVQRRKTILTIPDYEDPLCMPVKTTIWNTNDEKRLANWNKLCFEHLKHNDNLKPRTGISVRSRRTLVLRNFQNNSWRSPETAIWSKTVAYNKDGEQTSEVFQSVLPNYREKKVLDFSLSGKTKKTVHNKSTVLLSKQFPEDDSLVVYNVEEAMSSVYKLNEADESLNIKRHLSESGAWRACAACYQTSWRPAPHCNVKRNIVCAICLRAFISVYNFLAHVRVHTAREVRLFKSELSEAISTKLVDYHYKCRVCGQKFPSIVEMKKHIKTHTCNETFLCEVGNHVVSTV